MRRLDPMGSALVCIARTPGELFVRRSPEWYLESGQRDVNSKIDYWVMVWVLSEKRIAYMLRCREGR
jgi:hypothetical protein